MKLNNKPKIIGVGGERRSGKDTFVTLLRGVFFEKGLGATRIAFADPLKSGVMEMLGLTHQQVYGSLEDKETVDPHWGFTPRWALQFVGTELMRQQVREDVWLHTPNGPIQKAIRNPQSIILVPDVRFPNERQIIHDLGGVTVHTHRRPSLRGCGEDQYSQHASEAKVHEPPEPMYNVKNEGDLENDLKGEAEWIVQEALSRWAA